MVSITEHADDSPTGKLMEAIIESVDEFYSENLAQEVTRGMREAASRGFWITSHAPIGYNRVMAQDGPKKRPTLEINPDTSRIVKRIFDMADAGKGTLEITRTLNSEGISSPRGKLWGKASVHNILTNEAYTGTLLWGAKAKDKADPVRVEKAFPAIISKAQFRRVNQQLRRRAPKIRNPRRVGSSYLLSGMVRCKACDTPSTAGSPRAASTPTTSARRTSISARTPARLPASTPAASRSWSSTTWMRGNRHEKLRYSWAVDLETAGGDSAEASG